MYAGGSQVISNMGGGEIEEGVRLATKLGEKLDKILEIN